MPVEPKTILGIDPGFGRVGWGVIKFVSNSLKFEACGTIETTNQTAFVGRLKRIRTGLIEIIKKYQPDLAGVERLFFSKNIKTAMQVSEARGIILLTLADKKIKIFECTPQAVKQALVAYGRAEKLQIQRMVKTLLKLPVIPKPDDAADALAIAITTAFERKT
ncbi:crossover junction endodeoxyribonuclease RuvC [Candidatus Parcubacteria bacterium]|jgi:crossover junction endodeoxyribonuclease RuvC|nr:MAG: crossover junction endodeoxyribonuclease RuvC [Candidatus Parcubacteria bacterium]